MTEELERAIADACLGEQAGEAIARDLRGFLEARGVAAEDVDAILAAPHRLAVYRSLVRNGLAGVVVRMLPRTRARLNAACDGRFDSDVARFLEEVSPGTHYLRDVPAEFFAWARARWTADSKVPAYLPDLAAHELAGFAVAASESRPAGRLAELAPDRALAFADSARLMRYEWAVHELPVEETATAPPATSSCSRTATQATPFAGWSSVRSPQRSSVVCWMARPCRARSRTRAKSTARRRRS
jgi:hypothetical protein